MRRKAKKKLKCREWIFHEANSTLEADFFYSHRFFPTSSHSTQTKHCEGLFCVSRQDKTRWNRDGGRKLNLCFSPPTTVVEFPRTEREGRCVCRVFTRWNLEPWRPTSGGESWGWAKSWNVEFRMKLISFGFKLDSFITSIWWRNEDLI